MSRRGQPGRKRQDRSRRRGAGRRQPGAPRGAASDRQKDALILRIKNLGLNPPWQLENMSAAHAQELLTSKDPVLKGWVGSLVGPAAPACVPEPAASPATRERLAGLMASRGLDLAEHPWSETVTESQAMSLVRVLQEHPDQDVWISRRRPLADVRGDTPEGLHLQGGRVYRHQRRKGRGVTERREGPGWVPDHAVVLGRTTVLTRERAVAYGHEHGACAVCGRKLTRPSSVAAGIGPVCARNLDEAKEARQ